MTVFYLTIPLMVLAILVASVPLVLVSRREVKDLVRDAEQRFDQHQQEHAARRVTRRVTSRSVADRPCNEVREQRPWYEPVRFEGRSQKTVVR